MITYHQWMTRDPQAISQMQGLNEARAANWYQAYRAMASAISVFAGHLISNRRKKAAISELRALDDRMLSDIGISRNEILRVVEGSRDEAPQQPSEVSQPHETREINSSRSAAKPAKPGRRQPAIADLIEGAPQTTKPIPAAAAASAHASLMPQVNRIHL